MDPLPESRVEQTPAPEHWRVVGTVLWTVLIGLLFSVLQIAVAAVVALGGTTRPTEAQVTAAVERLLRSPDINGTALAAATCVTTLVCGLALVLAVKAKRRSDLHQYLAIHDVPVDDLVMWLGRQAFFLAMLDLLTVVAGRPLVPVFMRHAYDTAEPLWLLWFAVVVAAPLFEEALFRGFLYRGLAASLAGPRGAIVLTAVSWALLHGQYDLADTFGVLLAGVLLGVARWQTGSLLVPLAMHALANLIATIEAALMA